MSDMRLRNVVIAGGGTAGWMAAAAFSRFLNNGMTRITLIESDEIGTIGVGEATIPTLNFFHQMLGIDENAFLSATGGTFKLGIEFVDWARIGDRYLHPFGQFGQSIQGLAFHQIWAKLAKLGRAGALTEYSTSAAAAAAGRFARKAGDPRSPYGQPSYAFHFDAGLYAQFLRRYAEAGGVERIEGKIAEVLRDGMTGHVTELALDDGRSVAGDLFIDCTGFRGMLIGEAMGVGYKDWSHWLPCDRAVAVPTERRGALLPFTRATARDAGWQWRIPLQHRTGNGLVYSVGFQSPVEAETALLGQLDTPQTGDPRHLSFTAGHRAQFWEGNVVAIGLAGGFLEPLESTSIHLIQTGVSRLMALMPDRQFSQIERIEYNRLMTRSFEGVRDFIVAHYVATERVDTPFWQYIRTMQWPDGLHHRIELFREKGRFFRYDDELFDTANWVAILYGQRVVPRGWDPIVDALDEDKLADALTHIATAIRRASASMPQHADFIAAQARMPGIAPLPERD